MEEFKWANSSTLKSKSFLCGYCGNDVSSEKGFHCTIEEHSQHKGNATIYICHRCGSPTFFSNSNYQTPGAIYGKDVEHINDNSVKHLYNEVRKCISCNAATAAVLSCRKLLLHIAVSKGAKPNFTFKQCVEYLSDNGFIPPGNKEWVEHIKDKGNEANHEIILMKREDAEDLIDFLEMLLKFIYEFPNKMKQKKQESTRSTSK